jgi:hypothetical protein
MQLQGGERHWARQLGLPRRGPAPLNWTDDKIRAELTRYLGDKTQWPTSRQFLADGQSSLRTAITATGGVRRWAAEFDMPRDSPRHNGPIRYWTDDRIRAHLTDLCQGRTTFPSRQAFHRAGLQGLHHILQRDHTINTWARDLRLPHQPGGPAARKRSTAAPHR